MSCSYRAINRARAVPYRVLCLKLLFKPGLSTYRAVLKPVNYRVVPCLATKNRAVLHAGPLSPARFDTYYDTMIMIMMSIL